MPSQLSRLLAYRRVCTQSFLRRPLPCRRFASTEANAPVDPPISNPARPSQRSFAPYILGFICLSVGYASGLPIREYLRPTGLVEPGSDEDVVLLARLTSQIDSLPIVQELRAKYHRGLASEKENIVVDETKTQSVGIERDEGGSWRELLVENLGESEQAVLGEVGSSSMAVTGRSIPAGRTLTQKALAGARGLGVQRIFWNEEQRQLVAVVWFGGGVSGWPKVTHGGAIATLLDESLARCIAGPNEQLDSVPSPSAVALTYTAPTIANNFYVIRTKIADAPTGVESSKPLVQQPTASSWWTWLSPAKDMTKQRQTTLGPKVEVQSSLENLEGRVCVMAKATWESSDVNHLLKTT